MNSVHLVSLGAQSSVIAFELKSYESCNMVKFCSQNRTGSDCVMSKENCPEPLKHMGNRWLLDWTVCLTGYTQLLWFHGHLPDEMRREQNACQTIFLIPGASPLSLTAKYTWRADGKDSGSLILRQKVMIPPPVAIESLRLLLSSVLDQMSRSAVPRVPAVRDRDHIGRR